VLGLTFKENCPDLRNSKVADLVRELQDYGCEVSVHDPIAEVPEAQHEYGITLRNWDELPKEADAVVVAVAHRQYLTMPLGDIVGKLKPGGLFVDVKSVYDQAAVRGSGYELWRP
jgi:UDP-N-acetyl-D-galactosamine dehydrogenase